MLVYLVLLLSEFYPWRKNFLKVYDGGLPVEKGMLVQIGTRFKGPLFVHRSQEGWTAFSQAFFFCDDSPKGEHSSLAGD